MKPTGFNFDELPEPKNGITVLFYDGKDEDFNDTVQNPPSNARYRKTRNNVVTAYDIDVEYLVKNGLLDKAGYAAMKSDDAVPEPVKSGYLKVSPSLSTTSPTTSMLKKLKKPELQALAEQRELTLSGDETKNELVNLVLTSY